MTRFHRCCTLPIQIKTFAKVIFFSKKELVTPCYDQNITKKNDIYLESALFVEVTRKKNGTFVELK